MLIRRSSQRGFTLVELAIVLAIIGLVIAGIWTAAASVARRNRESKASQYLLEIVQNVRNLYAGQSSATGLTLANAITAGAIPADMRSGTGAVNPWNGAIDVATSTTSTSAFDVVYNNVPIASCIGLLTTTSVNSMEIGLIGLKTTGGTITLPGPATVATASTACGSGPTTSITWTYNVRN